MLGFCKLGLSVSLTLFELGHFALLVVLCMQLDKLPKTHLNVLFVHVEGNQR